MERPGQLLWFLGVVLVSLAAALAFQSAGLHRVGAVVAIAGLVVAVWPSAGSEIVADIWRNRTFLAFAALLSLAIGATLTFVTARQWDPKLALALAGMAFPGVLLLRGGDRRARRRALPRGPRPRPHPLKRMERRDNWIELPVILLGLAASIAALVCRKIGLSASLLAIMFVAGAAVRLALARKYHAGIAARRAAADVHFSRTVAAETPWRKVEALIEVLSSSYGRRDAWTVDEITVVAFHYHLIADAIAVAFLPAPVPSAAGAITTLPHPLTSEPVSTARLPESFHLPAQRGEFWSLFADGDCSECPGGVTAAAVMAELGRGPEGEIWGWVEGYIFCLWLGPLEPDQMRELAARCQTLTGVLTVPEAPR